MIKNINSDFLEFNIEKESIDLIISSPPFFNPYENISYGNTINNLDLVKNKNEYILLMKSAYQKMSELIKKEGTIILSSLSKTEDAIGYTEFNIINFFKTKEIYLNDVINIRNLRNQNHLWFVFSKEKSNNIKKIYLSINKKGLKSLRDEYLKSIKEKYLGTNNEQVIDYIIKKYSMENNLILDPFAGTGTVGQVAKSLNRSAICIEIEKEISKISNLYLEDESYIEKIKNNKSIDFLKEKEYDRSILNSNELFIEWMEEPYAS